MPDLLTVLVNIGTVIEPLIWTMQWVILLMGAFFTAAALVDLWGVNNANATKFLNARENYSLWGAATKMITGAIFVSLGTLEWMGIMSRTVTGDYATSRFLSYCASASACAGSTLQQQAQYATLALLGIMQIVGLVAMVKGWLTINARNTGRSNASYGQAATWMAGGVAAWNFKWMSDMLNNTIGFDLIGLFTPWS